jgi:hypothetical protein
MSRPLPRFTDQTIHHDPLETMLNERQAAHEQARTAINAGAFLAADPADLRGIPCLAHGVGGTSPGTNPYTACRDPHRLSRSTITT